MMSFVNYWYNKKNMLGELIFVVACFKEALRDFRDHPEYPGPILPFQFPPPPKPYFQHKHHRPTRVKKCGKAFDELFCSRFSLFSLVVTMYHWFAYIF